MKALVLAIALLGTSAASASEFVAFPHIGDVSIAKLCDAGNGTFVTAKPVKVCDLKQTGFASSHGEIQTVNEFQNVNCRYETVTISKKYKGSEIVSWNQGEASEPPVLRSVTKTYPRTWNVEVQNNLGEGQTLRYIKYTIPMCDKVEGKLVK